MAVYTCVLWITLCLCLTGSNGLGELTIFYSPASLQFTGSSLLKESMLKEMFLASLGLSINETSKWKGMAIHNPFNIPEAVVEVYIDGMTKFGDMINTFGQNYPMEIDNYESDTFQIIKHTISHRYPFGTNKMIAMDLSNDEEVNKYSRLFGNIKQRAADIKQLNMLRIGEAMDNKFLSEINVLKKITEKVNAGLIKSDNAVDFYTFRIISLHQLQHYYGKDSGQTVEAKEILNKALREMTDAFVKAYKGSVLVVVVTTDVCHSRRYARAAAVISNEEMQILADKYRMPYLSEWGSDGPSSVSSVSAAVGTVGGVLRVFEMREKVAVDEDLPLRTNLLLWFTICYIYVLIAVLYLIFSMQPDKDSIIYRMTTSRTKKEL